MSVITYYSSLALSLLADSNKEKQQQQQESISQKRDTKKSKRGSIKK